MVETSRSPLLSVDRLTIDFRSASGRIVQAVRDVSFQIFSEQTLAVVGESGSGKSVTSLAIMGLLPKRAVRVRDTSAIFFKGNDLLKLSHSHMRALRGRKISMIFQDPMSSLNPVFPVGFQLSEMLRVHKGMSRKVAHEKTLDLLHEVGIAEPLRRVNAYPHELSGGQQQRVMIAMALSMEPDLLIADEPTTALDVTIQRQIVQLLLSLQAKRRMAMIFITHDLALVSEFAHHAVVMRAGRVVEAGEVVEVFTRPKNTYTKALLMCRPGANKPGHRLKVLEDFISLRDVSSQEHRPQYNDKYPAKFGKVLLEVRNLKKVFDRRVHLFKTEKFIAVRDISFSIRQGQTLGIVGESGSGKTTTALCILRLMKFNSGQIFFDGIDLLKMSKDQISSYKRRVQIVFQNPFGSLNPRFTVWQILEEPMILHGLGSSDIERRSRACTLLEQVGLPSDSLNRYPHEFSGGQRQRISIARALALTPSLIVCDEPVSSLDVSVQAQILNLLKDLQQELGLSYLFISHDLEVVRHMSNELIVMRDGVIVEEGPAEVLYSRPSHSYTKELLNASPRLSSFVAQ
jgi:peptide/nickel transport system ATP-binding protein